MISKEAVVPLLGVPVMSFSPAEYEMVARVPIIEGGLRTLTFKTDIIKVWGMISAITIDLDCWTYVKSVHSKRDVRKACRDLWDHFLGTDNVYNMANEAERLLVATHYSGENNSFNFEPYVKIKNYQHHILEWIKEHGDMGICPRYQVRHLIQGIKITELDAVNTQIMATASFITDYDGCVYLYRKFIYQINKVSPPEINISRVESSNHK